MPQATITQTNLQTTRFCSIPSGHGLLVKMQAHSYESLTVSQRTFIQEDISWKLQCQVLGEMNVQLIVFGDMATKTYLKRRRVVRTPLCSQYDDGESMVEAIEVLFTSNDIVFTPADRDFVKTVKQLQGQISDLPCLLNVPTEERFGLLVGSVQLWEATNGTTLHSEGDKRLVATSTKFGWTFQGSTGS